MRFILTWYFFTTSLHGLMFVFTRHLIDFFFPPFPFFSVYLCLCYTAPCRRWLCMMLIVDCRWYPFSFDEPTVLYCSVFFARDAMWCLILHQKMLLGPGGVVSFFSRVLAPVSSASPYAHVGAHTLPSFVPHSLCKQVFRLESRHFSMVLLPTPANNGENVIIGIFPYEIVTRVTSVFSSSRSAFSPFSLQAHERDDGVQRHPCFPFLFPSLGLFLFHRLRWFTAGSCLTKNDKATLMTRMDAGRFEKPFFALFFSSSNLLSSIPFLLNWLNVF